MSIVATGTFKAPRELEHHVGFAAPFIAFHQNEMGVIRFERRAISDVCMARTPGVSDFSGRRDSKQLTPSAVSRERFAHHRHHAGLSAAVDNKRTDLNRRRRDSAR